MRVNMGKKVTDEMPTPLLALLLIGICMPAVAALRCYDCYSLKNLHCNDPFAKNWTPWKDYPAKDYVCVKLKGDFKNGACAATGANITAAESRIGLHCFACWSGEYVNCADPFNATYVPIQEYDTKSVCYKFRRGPDVWRGGMSEELYLKMYDNGDLDEYPLRVRCSEMLCNSAPSAAAPHLLLLLLLLAAPARNNLRTE